MVSDHPWLLLLAVVCVLAAIAAVRRLRMPQPARLPSGERQVKKWRCDSCRRSWYAAPGDRSNSRVTIALKRRARRRARANEKIEPAWAKAAGSERCPSCSSTEIRLSSRQ